MPWKKLDIDAEIQKECDASPEFKKMWEESREEYRLVGEMIRLRKQHNLTQRQLAQLAEKKQQIISRIEKHECTPSVRQFSNILNALGYELQIVKKTV